MSEPIPGAFDPPASGPEPFEAPVPPPRARLSRLLIAGVVVIGVALVGAVVVAGRADSSRRAAARANTQAAADLESQQARTAAAKGVLVTITSRASTYQAAAPTPLATAQQDLDLANQGLAAAQRAVAAGIANNSSAYNAAIDEANHLADQNNATESTLSTQIDQLPTP